MSHPKCRDTDYIDFLIASPRSASCCEAARSRPPKLVPPSHDAYTRLLTRLEPDPDTLFAEVESMARRDDGVLIADDSTLDHFHASKIELVHRHWSGKHKRVVRGINLISLVWSDGDRSMPVDYQLYDKPADKLTKNDHLQAMLRTAHARGFRPQAVLFDSWYSGLENLKLVRQCGWVFLTQLKANRKVDLDRQGYRAVSTLVFEGPSARWSLRGHRRSSPWRGSGPCGCSGSSPETGTRSTGRPTTWGWTSCVGWSWPSGPGRSRSTTGR